MCQNHNKQLNECFLLPNFYLRGPILLKLQTACPITVNSCQKSACCYAQDERQAGRRAAVAKVGEGEYTTDTTQRGNESMARFDISNRTHYRVEQKKGS